MDLSTDTVVNDITAENVMRLKAGRHTDVCDLYASSVVGIALWGVL